jgi:hypothetical protein
MNFPHLSLLRRGVIVSAAVMAVAVPIVASGAAGAAGPVAAGAPKLTAAKVAESASAKHVHIFTDSNGNRVEMIDPGQSHYIPNIAAASDADVAQAHAILDGVNEFCRTHSVKHIKAHWRPGGMGMHMKAGMSMKGMQRMNNMPGMRMKGMAGMRMSHTHWFNPNKLTGIHPKHPVAALIYKGVLDGVMFNGSPVLPALGTIPRPHVHNMDGMTMREAPLEMVHVYCTPGLKHAYTPNRQLGAMVPTQNLRTTIRPAVMLLKPWQLKEIRRMVRHMCGDRLAPVKPAGSWDGTGPDPVLQAMRTEIRHSLMILRQGQLADVWQRMRSYASVP